MLSKFFPGLLWLKGYSHNTLKSDLFSGLTIAVMLIPQGMGYAVVAGLPPEYGLYACIIPPVIYALLGTSNKISIGPVALDSILIITGLSLLAEPGSPLYLELAIVLTLLVGIIQCILGCIRFGFIANFLSYPVIVGYTSAAALIIISSQFENLVGTDVSGGSIFEIAYQLALNIGQWNTATIIVGIAGLLFMHYSKRVYPGLPYAFILLALGMWGAGLLNAASYGVDVVSSVPQGLPPVVIPNLDITQIAELLPLAFTVALMGYVGTMSICKSQEKPTDKINTNPNQELIAVGVANLVGSVFKAFPVSASFSRSAAFREAGALTQVSAVISAIFILVTVVFLTPLFKVYPLPKALLSAVIIISVIGLFKYKEMFSLAQHNQREFSVMLITFVFTLIFGVQQGLLIGVLLSIIIVIYNTTNPHMTELGSICDGQLYRNINRFQDAQVRDDTLIFRFDAPLYFANKDYFAERLYTWIKRRDQGNLKYVIFNAESVNSIDATAIIMLQQVTENLKNQGVKLLITNAIGPVRDTITLSNANNLLDENTTFSCIHDAIKYIDGGINIHPQQALQTNCR
ncbi:sulfate permease [Maricurvus nonylphenolicus]|uniref:SulP family inorganic anion transporter n=1 Tax=Maricurvus nonylphenolicus TaxID=1008307 RepID=UPI0036F350D9